MTAACRAGGKRVYDCKPGSEACPSHQVCRNDCRKIRYHFDKHASELLFKAKVKFNPDDYTTEQVFYQSADGTRVPMFISYKKAMKRDGQAPTYLYGYGGFDISSTPSFAPANLVWMEMGGIYAVANLRGGGEYGEKWHEAGMLHTKQNVFDDFIAAAQYLIDNKFHRHRSCRLAAAAMVDCS